MRKREGARGDGGLGLGKALSLQSGYFELKLVWVDLKKPSSTCCGGQQQWSLCQGVKICSCLWGQFMFQEGSVARLLVVLSWL